MSRNPYASDAPEADDAVVRFDDVSMRYGREPETLRDLSFSLPQGSFHFVTGPSGAGKTSLLKLIYLAAEPSRGLLHLFGQNVAETGPDIRPFLRRRIGVVFPLPVGLPLS
ncbi:MAG TPA: ATP-binding cassette domain-containing protein, partial [Phenylobacterium sp.]|nr:ATP-binding cassette domain-containing protein [Phenylobacterium sp.]